MLSEDKAKTTKRKDKGNKKIEVKHLHSSETDYFIVQSVFHIETFSFTKIETRLYKFFVTYLYLHSTCNQYLLYSHALCKNLLCYNMNICPVELLTRSTDILVHHYYSHVDKFFICNTLKDDKITF